ncbi:MAG: exosortase/archaeosortase family protein [Candidatus Bathyarchaeota archaeon]|nr:exosortase/archaeosortase family protein [Candidatus Bathyarchaeota archaeon]NLD67007.1 exosortase/archaeosortase family protein [Thermoproteota archaeon]
MDSQALTATLDRWQNGIKSPNFVPVAIKFSLLMAIPLFAFFQDFKEVFILAFSTAESQYILLVPFVIAYFFYRSRKALLVSSQKSYLHDFLGVSLCLVALLIYILGSYTFYSLQLHLLSLPIFVAGLILLFFGPNTLRLLAFPVALLVFMSPFTLFFMDTWGGHLMSSDGTIAAFILEPFMPIEIVYNPAVIISTVTTLGEPIQFELGAACSGIYSLTAFLFTAVIFGYIASGSVTKKVLYGVIAVAAAYFLNVFRIIVTIALGRFFGLGVAVEFFHLVGGTVLAFIGTLFLLFLGSKLLKLSFFQKKKPVCSLCSGSAAVCDKCGRIIKWPLIKLNWKRLAVLLVFLLVCADLIFMASAVNYNVLSNSEESALNFNPVTGELEAFSEETGWSAVFMGRQLDGESRLGLIFVGDYLLSKIGDSSDRVYGIFELSDLQSKFHTWEGCLNYQAYPLTIEKIRYVTIYDNNTNIVNGEAIIANAPTMNQTMALVYWFDSLNLKTNGTVTNYAIKVTLYKYVPFVNNQMDSGKVDATIEKLLSLSESYEVIWSQYKQTNNTFVVDLYKNSAAFTLVVLAIFCVSLVALLGKFFITRISARKKISGLSDEDKALIDLFKVGSKNSKTFSWAMIPEKVELLKQKGLLHEKFVIQNNDVYMSWVPY